MKLMDAERLKFLTLELRHQIGKAVYSFEKETERQVITITLERVLGREDALIKAEISPPVQG